MPGHAALPARPIGEDTRSGLQSGGRPCAAGQLGPAAQSGASPWTGGRHTRSQQSGGPTRARRREGLLQLWATPGRGFGEVRFAGKRSFPGSRCRWSGAAVLAVSGWHTARPTPPQGRGPQGQEFGGSLGVQVWVPLPPHCDPI